MGFHKEIKNALPASLIPLMSTCRLALRNIPLNAGISFSFILSKKTNSSGNRTFGRAFSGFCLANKLARRLILVNCLRSSKAYGIHDSCLQSRVLHWLSQNLWDTVNWGYKLVETISWNRGLTRRVGSAFLGQPCSHKFWQLIQNRQR